MSGIENVVARVVATDRRAFMVSTAALFAVSWATSFVAGGASALPPHLFYVPIVMSGLRFGLYGLLGSAAVATALAGPALPADVSAAVAQSSSDWIARGVFFLVIGAAVTSLVKATIVSERKELETAQREAELRAAIDRDELALRYQPIVRLDDGAVVGAEVLVRWKHPVRGLLAPDEFVPFAEERGVIEALGEWVLTTAIEDLRMWERQLGERPFPIDKLTVNVSRRQLHPNSRLVRRFDELVGDRGLPVRLVAEVTETSLSDDQSGLVDELMQLRLRGVQIAVDDFGTGHSSILALRDLPIDIIKIDKTFVQGLTTNTSDLEIVNATVELAHRRGNRVIAEGVEDDAQRRALAELGVELAQGFLFSHALPFEEFIQWAAAHRAGGPGSLIGRPRILVVDDKRTDHLYIGSLLQEHADVCFADTGWEAVGLLAESHYDVVLMDVQMPDWSGLDTVRAIRTLEAADDHDQLRRVIVGLSARDLPEDRDAALAAGMDAYLTKPLNLANLDRALGILGAPRVLGLPVDDETQPT